MSDNVIESNSNQKTSRDEVTFPQIVDMSLEDFKKYCVGLNATELLGLKNLMATTYVQVEKAKDLTVDKMMKDGKYKEDPQYKAHLQDLYILLQDLEDKVAYIRAFLKAPLN